MTKLTLLSILLPTIVAVGLAVRIEINSALEGPVTKTSISCIVGEFNGGNNRIEQLGIVGPDQSTVLASVTPSTISKIVNSISNSNMQVHGKINVHDIGKSYLTLTMNPVFGIDSGLYTCHLHYGVGALTKLDAASKNLSVEKQDCEKIDKYLMKNINTLNIEMESKQKDLDKQHEVIMGLLKSVKELQETDKETKADLKKAESRIKLLQGEFNDLDTREKYTVAFRAKYKDRYRVSTGKVVRFSGVELNVGKAYSPSTGFFTAPRDGIYAFHVTIDYADYANKYGLSFNLVANNKIVAAGYAFDKHTNSFANAAAAVELKKGHQVKVVIRSSSGSQVLDDDPEYSVFTGHLVKLL